MNLYEDIKSNLQEATVTNQIDVDDSSSKPDISEGREVWRNYTKSNPWGFVSNSAFSCPKCDSDLGLIYGYNQTSKDMHAAGPFEYDDDGWFFIPWKCKHCGTEGVVSFQVTYSGQCVFTKDGMVEVQDCGIKPVW